MSSFQAIISGSEVTFRISVRVRVYEILISDCVDSEEGLEGSWSKMLNKTWRSPDLRTAPSHGNVEFRSLSLVYLRSSTVKIIVRSTSYGIHGDF